ncbi:hypothetical protein N0B31_22135 (plasmid) [Salinirubellus salinus]|uniref:Uncharacterized protein n=1 Tax=Salinirubellus salinus TaxID=1364945 RepID=A0A9E7R9I1_9EURY|nr:hypothetical protein [Salinirubellus salinus]UWM56948.1 hypothetical protein N0B31_22135 [Salinirubellus salinus]
MTGFAFETPDRCVVCAGSADIHAVVTYHRAGLYDSELQSGHLCSSCVTRVETILNWAPPSECDFCSAPFPEAVRHDVMMYDPENTLFETCSICSDCYDRQR